MMTITILCCHFYSVSPSTTYCRSHFVFLFHISNSTTSSLVSTFHFLSSSLPLFFIIYFSNSSLFSLSFLSLSSSLVRPGEYLISRRLGKDHRNPKNIMLSSTERDPFGAKALKSTLQAPGPGTYQVSSSLIRPSHNILLSDRY
jgi:hypothetical protein